MYLSIILLTFFVCLCPLGFCERFFDKGWERYLSSNPVQVLEPEVVTFAEGKPPSWLMGSLIVSSAGLFDCGKARNYSHLGDLPGKLTAIQFRGSGDVTFQTVLQNSPLSKDCGKDERKIKGHRTFGGVVPSFDQSEVTLGQLQGMSTSLNLWKSRSNSSSNNGYDGVAFSAFPNYLEFNPRDVRRNRDRGRRVPEDVLYSCGQPRPWPETNFTVTCVVRREKDEKGHRYAVLILNRIVEWSEQHPNDNDWKEFMRYEFPNEQLVPYLNSFVITESHVVFVSGPARIKSDVVNSTLDLSTGMNWTWNGKSQLLIFDLKKKSVNVIEANEGLPTYFVQSGHINAYHDTKNSLTIDVVATTPDAFFGLLSLKTQLSPKARDMFPLNRVHFRFRIDLVNLKLLNVTSFGSPLGPGDQWPETNIINAKYIGKKNCYSFGLGTNARGNSPYGALALTKKCMCSEKHPESCKTLRFGSGPCRNTLSQFYSPPTFVPRPDHAGEDDGVILSTVFDGQNEGNKSSYLLILNATNFEIIGRTNTLPTFVPYTFRTLFFDDLHLSD